MPVVRVQGHGELHFDSAPSYSEVARACAAAHPWPIVAVRVGNRVVGLAATAEADCDVELVDLASRDGVRLYEHGVAFAFLMAAKALYPGCRVTMEHHISHGIYGELYWDRALTSKDFQAVARRMREIVDADMPLESVVCNRRDALKVFTDSGDQDKQRLLETSELETVELHRCGGHVDSFYGPAVASTGCLKWFELRSYTPGFILQLPDPSEPCVVPAYREQRKLATVFAEAERWGNILGVADVGQLNEHTLAGRDGGIVRVAEALHEKRIAQMADAINAERERLRVVLIAGPSSSGKTTFAQRLLVQLRVNGLRPLSISLDDYFVSRDETPVGPDGKPDFECLEAVDVKLFNEHLQALIQGESVSLPTFNFATGAREFRGSPVRVAPDQPLIIEGIHGLNDRLTQSIPGSRKYCIYVSAITALNIDDHSRIPTTDVRLLRRIVRDSQFRSHDALQTIRMWPSVRRGEERNIFPFQENADVMFNSALVYEVAVLKRYAEPLLEAVPNTVPEYSEAERLLSFAKYFRPIGDLDVPRNSIAREFIGGTCFI